MPDPQVLDVFSRLNSYSVVLNEQEKINANHFGPFKLLADQIAKKYFEFWIQNKIISEKKCLRMDDVNLTADLLIAMCVGIKEKKKIKTYYDAFEKEFDYDSDQLSDRFDNVMYVIQSLFPNGMSDTEFVRVHLFYSLFTAFYHLLYGLPSCAREGDDFVIDMNNERQMSKIRHRLDRIGYIFDKADEDIMALSPQEQQFIDSSRRATTDASKRNLRTKFIVELVAGAE